MQLGNIVFPTNLIQGPLAGVSCAPFRALASHYIAPAFSCTEMISCKTLVYSAKSSYHRYVAKHPKEGPVCFQLSGTDANELSEAVKIATDCGADLIDLNCGCPVKKIRDRGAGSKLLMNPSRLYELIVSMKKSTHIPVSVKIRVEGQSDDVFHQDIANVISEAGADFLVVHGRHWTEHYETACHHEDIQFFAEALKIPVIGNGDIACVESLRKMFATGCAGVMIGRAGVGQPWLISQLTAEMNQAPFQMPSTDAIGNMMMTHVNELAVLLQNETLAVLQARKFAKYYARKLPRRDEFVNMLNVCQDIESLRQAWLICS